MYVEFGVVGFTLNMAGGRDPNAAWRDLWMVECLRQWESCVRSSLRWKVKSVSSSLASAVMHQVVRLLSGLKATQLS